MPTPIEWIESIISQAISLKNVALANPKNAEANIKDLEEIDANISAVMSSIENGED